MFYVDCYIVASLRAVFVFLSAECYSVCIVRKRKMSSPEISKWRLELLNESYCT